MFIKNYNIPIKELFTKNFYKNFFVNLIKLQEHPSKTALSIALGIFIGLLFPVGLQTIIVVPLAVLLKCNVFISATATLITNPLTIIPIYYSAFRIGEFLTNIKCSFEDLQILFVNPSFDNFYLIGSNSLIVFFTGSLLISICFSVFIYFLSLKLLIFYKAKKKN